MSVAPAATRKGRRVVGCDPLRELRATDALAAREATQWLSELEFARKSPRTTAEYGRLIDGLLQQYPHLKVGEFTEDELTTYIASFNTTADVAATSMAPVGMSAFSVPTLRGATSPSMRRTYSLRTSEATAKAS